MISRRSLLAAPALLATSNAFASTRITIPSTGDGLHYMPVYVARAAGLFAAEGLEVDWLNVTGGTRQAAAVMGGSAEMTPLAMIHVVKAAIEGANLAAFCPIFDVYAMSVVLSHAAIEKVGIAPGMGIDEKVRRLKGLKLGMSSPGSSADAVIRSLLLARGMDPDRSVQLQPLGNGASILAAFEKKLVDGFVWTAPAPELAEARGLGRVVIDPFKGEVPEQRGVPYVVMATSRETWAAKREVIMAATRAMTRAMRLIHSDGDRTRALLRPSFPDIEDAIFTKAVETYRAGVPRQPMIASDNLTRTLSWMNIGVPDKVSVPFDAVVLPEPGAARQGPLAMSAETTRSDDMPVLVGRIAVLAFLLAGWEALARMDDTWTSSPHLVGMRLLRLAEGELWPHLATTLAEIAVGLGTGVPLGVATGLVLGRLPLLASLLRPLIVAAYSVPLVTLAPLLILWFGLDLQPKIVLVGAVSFFLLFFTTFAGVTSIDEDLVSGLRLMGASQPEIFRKLILPASAAWVFSGLRTAIPYALIAATVGEMMAARRGLGALLTTAASQIDMTGLYAAILVLMALGAAMGEGAARFEGWMLSWREGGR